MKMIKTNELPEVGVSHNPDILKKVFIENGEVPKLTNFGEATFKPGQSVETHQHNTKYEIFYVTNGLCSFVISDEKTEVSAGDCIIIEPGEPHFMINETDFVVSWLYFGIATN